MENHFSDFILYAFPIYLLVVNNRPFPIKKAQIFPPNR